MKWRCEWCGKPHERNDPPCEECGHHSFEKAVVPAAPEREGAPTVWACTACGREHPRNNPPCSRCGNMALEQREQSVDDLTRDPAETEPGSAGESGDVGGAETTLVWACTECGRTHPRNNPPCSRCGHMQLERREQRFDDAELGGGGWRDALELKYVAGFLGAFALLGVIAAGSAGIVDVPGLGPPTVDDVPGDAEESGGFSLATVEAEYVAALDARTSGEELRRGDSLQSAASYYNQRRVKAEYADGEPPDIEAVLDEFDLDCSGGVIGFYDPVLGSLSSYDSEAELAESLADRVSMQGLDGEFEAVGIDVHVAPDGAVYVTHLSC